MNLERPIAPDPYELLPRVPPLRVTSESFADGDILPDAQVFDEWGFKGGNSSPQLSWSGAPNGTRAYAVTCFDPDAPTPSGFWHWILVGLPSSVTSLAAGAGTKDGVANGALPEHAQQMPNDYGYPSYGGAAPPDGDRPHRYLFAVHALDTDTLGLGDQASAAVTAFNIGAHTVARGVLTGRYAAPA